MPTELGCLGQHAGDLQTVGGTGRARHQRRRPRQPAPWDNDAVHDGPLMSRHLHLRRLTGRRHAIADQVAGDGIQLALQPHLSPIPPATLAASHREGDDHADLRGPREAVRQVFAQCAALPRNKTLPADGNTRSVAPWGAMALRMNGLENPRLPYGGFGTCKARGGPEAQARAGGKR